MDIRRIGITTENGALISRGVVGGDTVMLSGIAARDLSVGIEAQMQDVLTQVEDLLAEAGSSREHVLTAHVWLADMDLFKGMNAVWNEWVDPERPPSRTCVSGELYRSDCLVEVVVTALVADT